MTSRKNYILVAVIFIISWGALALFASLLVKARMDNQQLKNSLEVSGRQLVIADEAYRRLQARSDKLSEGALSYLEWKFLLKDQVSGAQRRLLSRIDSIANIKKDKQLLNLLYYTLGLSCTLSADFDAAIKDFQQAVNFDPKDAESFYNLGLISSAYRQTSRNAAGYYKKYLELVPKGPKADEVRERIKVLEKP
jgi:tetratricopeptide (TPR) repeat protein